MVCTVSGTTGSTVTMVSVGTCTIQATQAGSSSWAAATPVTQSFQVMAATLQSIAVTPASPTIAKGLTQQFTAIGTYSDSSTQNLTALVTWASATTGVATIASSGLATAAGVGMSNITATLSSVTGSTLLTVMAPMCNVTPDGVAGVADVQRMIDEALGIMAAVNDFNGDGVVNGADVQIVINAALGQGCTAP
jgi:hypothetical protein